MVIAVTVFGYMAFTGYQDRKFVEAMSPPVKNSSLRLTNSLRSETDDKSSVTFKELFENIEASIAEIDKRILDIQTIETPGDRDKTSPVLAYLKGCQETLRAQLSLSRKRLAVRVAEEMENKAARDVFQSGLSTEFTLPLSQRATAVAMEAKAAMESAQEEYVTVAKKMLDLRTKAVKVMPPDTMVDRTALLALISKLENKQDSIKKP